MDRIEWDNPAFRRFLDQCDVIAASNKVIQKHLSMKWPYKIEYIPNGFYNFSNCDLNIDFSKKENVLLTVGRIGTDQKNNELLLEVFAKIADKIPTWSLRLVGGVEETFQAYIGNYFKKYPNLKDRVAFTGNISDRRQLMEEYKKAKIFALTSRWEGTPNVTAEALYGGCYMVISSIDAAADAVDGGRCGQIFTNGDQLSSLLIQICHQPELLEKGGHNAVEYAHRVFDFNNIIKRLHYLLFQEDKNA
jgi:glycosyltransferase involved in cell wall biosynthesis